MKAVVVGIAPAAEGMKLLLPLLLVVVLCMIEAVAAERMSVDPGLNPV